MKKYQFEGKTEEEIIEKAINELNVSREEIIINNIDTKAGFLKAKKMSATVILQNDIVNYLKEYLNKVFNLMGIKANIEIKKRENNIKMLVLSDQNPILIGKDGRTIDAFQLFLNQLIYNETGIYFRISLDVGEYKLKKEKKLEMEIKKIANSVIRSKVPAKLDPMNSYERRIIHTILSEYKGVSTTSEGEEPNRYVVIKPKE
jgi:spoIIIJ-associated protein